MAEWSTLFLNVRVICRLLGRKPHRPPNRSRAPCRGLPHSRGLLAPLVLPVLLDGLFDVLLSSRSAQWRAGQEVAISALFALIFFATRVAIFGAVVLHLLSQRTVLSQLLSPPLQLSYFGLLPAVYCLNLFWFAKICQGIVRVLQ